MYDFFEYLFPFRFSTSINYIPLGGNRRGTARTCINMATVCILCGLWHGANWTFLFWGIYHGVFLILERFTGIRDVAPDKFHITRRVVTLIVVMVGWVFFRAENISQAIGFLGVMFSVTDLPLTYELRLVLNYRNILFMMTALTVFFMPGEFFGINILIHKKDAIPLFAGVLMILMLLPYCVALIVGGSNSPFIYYRF